MLEIGIIGRAATVDEVEQAQCRYRAARMPEAAKQGWSASARDLRPVRTATAAEFSAMSFGDPHLLG